MVCGGRSPLNDNSGRGGCPRLSVTLPSMPLFGVPLARRRVAGRCGTAPASRGALLDGALVRGARSTSGRARRRSNAGLMRVCSPRRQKTHPPAPSRRPRASRAARQRTPLAGPPAAHRPGCAPGSSRGRGRTASARLRPSWPRPSPATARSPRSTRRPSGSTPAADRDGAARPRGARRLLDVLVRQLAADAAVRQGLVRAVRERGLVVVGVHAPEFGFEHDLANVRRAVGDLGVGYPVVIDNDFAIWRAFENHYWPAVYLVDATGASATSTSARRPTRRPNGRSSSCSASRRSRPGRRRRRRQAADWDTLRSPETYVGDGRGERRATRRATAGAQRVGARRRLVASSEEAAVLDAAAARSRTASRRATSTSSSRRRPGAPVRFTVRLDGQPPGDDHGLDIDESGEGTVAEPRMYQLVRQRGAVRRAHLRDHVPRPRRARLRLHLRLTRSLLRERRFRRGQRGTGGGGCPCRGRRWRAGCRHRRRRIASSGNRCSQVTTSFTRRLSAPSPM